MDCLADLLSQKGMEGTLAWCEAGLKLRCRSSGETSGWVVLGHLPEEEGNGKTAASTSPQQLQQRAMCKACTRRLQCCTQGLCLHWQCCCCSCGCSCSRHWHCSQETNDCWRPFVWPRKAARSPCCRKQIHLPTLKLNMQQVIQVWHVHRALGVPLFRRPLPTPLQ